MSTQTNTQASPLVIVVVIVIFVAVFGFFAYTLIKRREETFEGEVIDKDVIEERNTDNYGPRTNGIGIGGMNMNRPGTISIGNQGGVTHTYRIKVRTTDAKEINYPISEGKYEIIKIGDRVSKAKGTTEVEIISSGTNTTPPAAPTAPAPPAPTPPSATPPTAS